LSSSRCGVQAKGIRLSRALCRLKAKSRRPQGTSSHSSMQQPPSSVVLPGSLASSDRRGSRLHTSTLSLSGLSRSHRLVAWLASYHGS
jgi:hypothetical protein